MLAGAVPTVAAMHARGPACTASLYRSLTSFRASAAIGEAAAGQVIGIGQDLVGRQEAGEAEGCPGRAERQLGPDARVGESEQQPPPLACDQVGDGRYASGVGLASKVCPPGHAD